LLLAYQGFERGVATFYDLPGIPETRTYNSLLQLTRDTVRGVMDMQYNYTALEKGTSMIRACQGKTEISLHFLEESPEAL